MGVKMSGFDDLRKFFKNLEKNIKKASGDVSFEEIFNPSFMKKYSKFNNIDEFLDNSPFKIETQEDFDNLDEKELDKYIKEVTKFSSWNEMKQVAAEIYIKKKLGF